MRSRATCTAIPTVFAILLTACANCIHNSAYAPHKNADGDGMRGENLRNSLDKMRTGANGTNFHASCIRSSASGMRS